MNMQVHSLSGQMSRVGALLVASPRSGSRERRRDCRRYCIIILPRHRLASHLSRSPSLQYTYRITLVNFNISGSLSEYEYLLYIYRYHLLQTWSLVTQVDSSQGAYNVCRCKVSGRVVSTGCLWKSGCKNHNNHNVVKGNVSQAPIISPSFFFVNL